MKNPRLIQTKDGSNSLYIESLDETYHSTHGARQESQHVYIKSGLEHLIASGHEKEVRIFEMGFGTGLNAYLTNQFALDRDLKVYYESIELFPITTEEHLSLGYHKLPELTKSVSDCQTIIDTPWDSKVRVNSQFELKKVKGDFFNYELNQPGFNLLFFDAFGHRAQSEMWEFKAFEKCAEILQRGGILVTYASKGLARRNLVAAGFKVEKIEGAPGKREMMRATKL